MKKIKLAILLMFAFVITGCLKNDTMEDITIYTTSYPIEYVTSRLYGEHSEVKSIYPDGMQEGYKVSDKLIEDYSKGDLFIFNGLMEYYELDSEGKEVLKNDLPVLVSEKNYVFDMLELNHDLKIIDVSASIMYDYDVNELWLDPIKFLTVANNVKKGFYEYVTNKYLLNEIDENYQALKQELLKLDADYREVANRSSYNTIVVADDCLKFLQKYDINVISLEENENLTQKNIKDAEELIANGDVKYIYVIDENKNNETITNLTENTEVTLIKLSNLNNLSEENRKNNDDYFTIMYSNLDKIKEELYK